MNRYNFTYLISLLLFFFGCNLSVQGCLDPTACNYNPNANVSIDSCIYPQENFDCDGVCLIDIDCDGVCGGEGNIPSFTDDWYIQVIASMEPWNILDTIFDENNILGVSDSASDDFDSMDAPEPPSQPGNWISGYFYHPEWDSLFGDNFTQEYQSNEFCGTKEWNFTVEANSLGPLEIEFIFNNVPQNVYIEIVEGDVVTPVSDNFIFESALESNVPKELLIKVSVN